MSICQEVFLLFKSILVENGGASKCWRMMMRVSTKDSYKNMFQSFDISCFCSLPGRQVWWSSPRRLKAHKGCDTYIRGSEERTQNSHHNNRKQTNALTVNKVFKSSIWLWGRREILVFRYQDAWDGHSSWLPSNKEYGDKPLNIILIRILYFVRENKRHRRCW